MSSDEDLSDIEDNYNVDPAISGIRVVAESFPDFQDVTETEKYVKRFFAFERSDNNTILPQAKLVSDILGLSDMNKESHLVAALVMLVSDLVLSAGLLHPDLVLEYQVWKDGIIKNVQSSWETISEIQLLMRKPHVPPGRLHRSSNWIISVLDVFSCFHSFEFIEDHDETRFPLGLKQLDKSLAAMKRHVNNRAAPSFALKNTSMGGSNDCMTFAVSNIPDFYFALLMDYGVEFGGTKKTRIVGPAQPQINYREGVKEVFEGFLKTLSTGTRDDVKKEVYMNGDAKEGLMYCSRFDDDTSSGGTSRVVSAVTGSVQFEEHVPFSRVSVGSVRVSDAYDFAKTWCDVDDLSKNGMSMEEDDTGEEFVLLTVPPKEKHAAELGTHDEVAHLGRAKNLTKRLSASSEDPKDVVSLLEFYFKSPECSNILSRENSVDINKRMLTRFIIKTYGESVTKDKLGKYLEKLEKDISFVDEGQGKFFGHPSDFFGLIWLINLASHRLRCGLSSGRHRIISELMAANGSEFRGRKHYPSFLKTVGGPLFKKMDHGDYIYHQLNNAVPVTLGLSKQTGMEVICSALLKSSLEHDVSSQKQKKTNFDLCVNRMYHNVRHELEEKDCFRDKNSLLDPLVFSHPATLKLDLDVKSFNVAAWYASFRLAPSGQKKKLVSANMDQTRDSQVKKYQESLLMDLMKNLKMLGGVLCLETDFFNAEKKNLSSLRGTDPYRIVRQNGLKDTKDLLVLPDHFRRLCSDSVLETQKKIYDKTTFELRLEEVVHACTFMEMYRQLKGDAVFKQTYVKASSKATPDQLMIGFIPKHYLYGNSPAGMSSGAAIFSNAINDTKNHLFDFHLQSLLCVFTFLRLHPRGDRVFPYFVEDRHGRELSLQSLYQDKLFKTKNDPIRIFSSVGTREEVSPCIN